MFDFVPREDQICAGGEGGKDSCGVSFVSKSKMTVVWVANTLKEGVPNYI